MSKYPISKDFRFARLLTFPVMPWAAPIAEVCLGVFMHANHSDKNVNVSKIKINVEDADINALFYEPINCKNNAPLLVYFHGGAYMYKAAPYHFRLVKEYCVKANCKVLMVDYRLAPKHKYPIPVMDCYKSLEYAVRNAEKLGIDKSKIAVGGDSAGGGIAASVVLMARDRNLAHLCGQMLIYPVLDKRINSNSMKKYTDTPVWNAKLTKKMMPYYFPSNTVELAEYASAVEVENLSNLPSTYIETAEFDCLHDDGINYAIRLNESSVNVELYETKGTMHGFDMVAKSSITTKSMEKRISVPMKKEELITLHAVSYKH
ncbi:MAG: alpha/beta hydrolase, partial [Eubacterium sp.]|nr:alpha/beta hydrolase [Eubacterium sp.]